MSTSADPVYLDASALVKLVVREAESDALDEFLKGAGPAVSCSLVRVEVIRAIRRHDSARLGRARELVRELLLLPIGDALLEAAADLDDPALRSLDALHVAAARSVRPDLRALVSYDLRMLEAATGLGLPTASPA